MEEKIKFPIKTLIGSLAYGLVAEHFDFGSQDWFPALRPDIWLAHPMYGYFVASLGRYGAEKLNLLRGKKDLASRVAGGVGLVTKEVADLTRYGTFDVFSIGDMMGGAFGVLLENYLALRNKESQKDF